MGTKARTSMGPMLESAHSRDSGCPAPETFLMAELATLTTDERAAVVAHAARCPACAAEQELAAVFDAEPNAIAGSQREIGPIVARLESSMGEHLLSGGGPSVAATDRFPLLTWAPRLAAAVVLLVVGGALFQALRPGPPPLPRETRDEVARGSTVEIVYPVGDLESFPHELRWVALRGAASYDVSLFTVGGEILWRQTVTKVTVRLPDSLIQNLAPMVSYFWSVDALDTTGAHIGVSEEVFFRIGAQAVP